MYRIAMPMHRIEISSGEGRSCTSGLELFRTVVLVEGDRAHQQDQERHRHGRGNGPIPVAEELIPEDAPDHEIVRPAEERGDHELADRGDEHQHRARR